MRNLPPLPALRAFEAVARLGSVVKAAEELYVTHSAVSHQLRALEDYVGVDLFKREGKRLVTNEDGRIYAYQVRRALNDIAAATESLLSQPRENELMLAILPSFASHWLIPRLPSLSASLGEIRLTLRASLDFVDFTSERVDAAIRMGVGTWPDVQSERLMDDSVLLVASPGFRNGRLPQTAREVIESPLLLAAESWAPFIAHYGLDAEGFSAHDLRGPTFNDSNPLLEAARMGQGVAITRRSIAHEYLRTGQLVKLLNYEEAYTYPYWLVWSSRVHGHPKIECLRAWMAEAVRLYQAELETGD